MNKYINKMASLYRYATFLSNINHNLFICILISLLLPTSERAHAKVYGAQPSMDGERRLTKEYQLRQGSIRGLIVQPGRNYELQSVEMFLGIPYAAPPVGSQRFMPPGSALPWSGVKMATQFAPVCPQMLPAENKNNPLSPGRQQYMRRLATFLGNESEDCLYLNVYAPKQDHRPKKLPVLVFIHGDSFEWSSGNPYDGRILASYGNVMIVTINFRLGIFGFMKPSLTDHAYGNNGLLDQLAALKWVQDNIADLHGDPNSVTLMGHGTGAACVNFLMISPIIPDGLFHRAILMSGSALSDWALTKDPMQYTIQVAQNLNCHISNNTMACLQNKRMSDIKKVQILARKFATPLGPMVAGSFIPAEPSRTIESYPNILSKYELLTGVTELESYHEFRVIELGQGVIEKERDEIIDQFAQVLYDTAADVAAKDIKLEYFRGLNSNKDWGINANRENRDYLLDALSDARTVAPLVLTANYHSKANPRSYFYVFGHNSEHTDFAALKKSVSGEELPYVFGVPLGGARTHFHEEFTVKERLLSEVVMTKWSNFVKTGSPNSQKREHYLTLSNKDWSQYNLDWPEYNVQHQTFLHIDVPPSHFVRSFYRANYTKFWNEVLPNKMKNYAVSPLFEYEPAVASTSRPRKTLPSAGSIERNNWKNPLSSSTNNRPEISAPSYGRPRQFAPAISYSSSENVYKEIKSIKTPSRPVPPSVEEIIRKKNPTKVISVNVSTEMPVRAANATVSIIITIGCIFLLVNVIIFTILFIKKKSLKARERQLKSENNTNADNIEPSECCSKLQETSKFEQIKSRCNIFKTFQLGRIKRSHKKNINNQSLSIKTPKSDDSGGFGQRFKLRRHLSSSTIDANTKVRDWITNDVLNKSSPSIEIKLQSEDEIDSPKILKNDNAHKSDCLIQIKNTIPVKSKDQQSIPNLEKKTNQTSDQKNYTSLNEKYLEDTDYIQEKPVPTSKTLCSKSCESLTSKTNSLKKVSVAIDATPRARTKEILRQKPIEFSKSTDVIEKSSNKLNESTPLLQRSKTENDVETELNTGGNGVDIVPEKNYVSTINLSLKEESKTKGCNDIIKISHKHSISDPVKDINFECINKSDFCDILPPTIFRNDVNVTSKDETDFTAPLTASEALLTIKRRNFPKVLPDLPKSYINQKRLSLQPNSIQSFKTFMNNEQFNKDQNVILKVPPLPPPRISSTLDRRLGFKDSKIKGTSSFDSGKSSFGTNKEILFNSKDNYCNFEMVASLFSEINKNKDENKSSDSCDKSTTSSKTFKKREIPKVIIAANDIPNNNNDFNIITKPFIEKSKAEIQTNVPRVRLSDNFHETGTESECSGSSLSVLSDLNENFDENEEDGISDAEMIEALVGSSELSIIRDIPDTKGPDHSLERKLEIIPVKVNVNPQSTKNYETYKYYSDEVLPDASNLEKTAQIKQKYSFNKLQNRSEYINKPLEKEIQLKDRKLSKTPPFVHKIYREQNFPVTSKMGKFKTEIKDKKKIPLQHSNSESSNDTESSTGTVKFLDLKK